MISCVCESEHCMPTSVQIEGVKSFLSRKSTAYDGSVSTEGSKGKTHGKGYSGVCVLWDGALWCVSRLTHTHTHAHLLTCSNHIFFMVFHGNAALVCKSTPRNINENKPAESVSCVYLKFVWKKSFTQPAHLSVSLLLSSWVNWQICDVRDSSALSWQ